MVVTKNPSFSNSNSATMVEYSNNKAYLSLQPHYWNSTYVQMWHKNF